MPKPWTETEISRIVSDYFEMLKLELSGIKFNKTEHRNKLIPKLDNRSGPSIEYKHQNISAILIELGMPYITGYKPAFNYQRYILPDVILNYLDNHPEIEHSVTKDIKSELSVPTVENILEAIVSPPKSSISESSQDLTSPKGKIDYLAREASNIELGKLGEEFSVNYEKARLISIGKENFADMVEQVSITEGDHLGYDVKSYEKNGTDRFIEAKTTRYGISTPFYLSQNELQFSLKNKNQYHLYRVFEFREKPKLYILDGDISRQIALTPQNYICKI